MGGGLHEPAAHFVHPGDLQFTGGLVDPGQDGTPCRHFQRVGVPAGVGDKGHLLCKAVHAAFDGSFVVKGSGGHLCPCPVQLPLKRSGDGVGGGGGQVLPCAPGLLCPGGKDVGKSLTVRKGGAKWNRRKTKSPRQISIHALREEGDHGTDTDSASSTNFYPRPP